jgi:hypothetical protein
MVCLHDHKIKKKTCALPDFTNFWMRRDSNPRNLMPYPIQLPSGACVASHTTPLTCWNIGNELVSLCISFLRPLGYSSFKTISGKNQFFFIVTFWKITNSFQIFYYKFLIISNRIFNSFPYFIFLFFSIWYLIDEE